MFEKIDFTKLVRLKINRETGYVRGRLIQLKGRPAVQFEYSDKGVISHVNTDISAAASQAEQAAADCKNAVIVTEGRTYEFKRSKKGKLLSHSYANDEQPAAGANDRTKRRVLDTNSRALYELGITTADGKVKADKQVKFRQIDRFADIVGGLIDERAVKIVDFGCGKSYLDFVLREYLDSKGIRAEIAGLDIRPDVIETCETLRRKLGYDNMRFVCADAKDYPLTGADMVVSLHACDTATDHALYQAVRAGVKYIVSVPCCQHEINATMTGGGLFAEYGIIKERAAALATDAVRAALLESVGYNVQVLEYVDDEHSLKNIMLRCVRRPDGKGDSNAADKARALLDLFGARQTLYDLLLEGSIREKR